MMGKFLELNHRFDLTWRCLQIGSVVIATLSMAVTVFSVWWSWFERELTDVEIQQLSAHIQGLMP